MTFRGIVTMAVHPGLFCLVLVGSAGAADPSFTPGGTLPVGQSPSSFEVADLNGDAHPDFAVANHGSDDLTILLGDGGGGFAAAAGSPVAAGDGPFALATADLNGDRTVDLAVANNRSNNLTVHLGNGAGGFGAGPGSPILVAALRRTWPLGI